MVEQRPVVEDRSADGADTVRLAFRHDERLLFSVAGLGPMVVEGFDERAHDTAGFNYGITPDGRAALRMVLP